MQTTSKAVLLCGVSALAITAALPITAQAADLVPKAHYQAPPPPQPVSPWTVWLEGGAQGVSGGDSSIPGLTPAFTPGKKTWGWSAAGGVDYRLDPFWHVSADFRYGQNKSRTTNSIQHGSVCISAAAVASTCSSTGVAGPNSATRKESNWVADFMVGRDVGLGGGPSQVKFGLRVAQIRGTTNGAGLLITITPTTVSAKFAYNQTSKWLGFGPRLAIEGSAPIAGAWSLDYMGGVAVLFGHQSVSQTVGITTSSGLPCVVGCPVPATFIGDNTVFNADGMLGIAYAFTPYSKLGLNYRVDYYNDALSVLSSTGGVSNASRLYHGPNLRWTVNF